MTIGFADFDRRIADLSKSLDALKGNPDEASKKIEAFLKDNEPFFLEHKKDSHVKEQLDILAGKVKQIFPESKTAKLWADYLQSIPKSPMKIVLEPKEFTRQLNKLKKALSDASGEQMSPELYAQVEDFLQNPSIRDFVNAYGRNPTIGRQLLELGIILKKFRSDPLALETVQDLLKLAKDMQLPDELIFDSLKYIPPHQPPGKLPEEWNTLSIEAKIEWMNEHPFSDEVVFFNGFGQNQDATVRFLFNMGIDEFLENYGSKLHVLYLWGGNVLTDETLAKFLSLCPNLKILSLSGDKITQIPLLPPRIESLQIANMMSLRTLPEKWPKNLQALWLESLLGIVGQVPKFPKGLKTVLIITTSCRELPPFEEGLTHLWLGWLNHLQQMPRLPQSLKVLSLEGMPRLPRFNLPDGLQLFFGEPTLANPTPPLDTVIPPNCKVDKENTNLALRKLWSSYLPPATITI